MHDHPTQKCFCCGDQKPIAEFPFLSKRRVRNCEACRSRPEKPCADCGISRPVEDFAWQQASTNKLRYRGSVCKVCRARRCREWNARPGNNKRGNLRRYGLSLADYQAMAGVQRGACAVCGDTVMPIDKRTGKPYDLAVDHCHDCGAVRSLLCPNCNNGLGCFRDDPKRLQAAIEYLQKHVHKSLPINDQEG